MARLGIDYGTTNTVVVAGDRGRYPVVPHLTDTGAGTVIRDVFPSLMAYDRAERRWLFGAVAVGGWLVGSSADDLAHGIVQG